jgi:hypothetical protein
MARPRAFNCLDYTHDLPYGDKPNSPERAAYNARESELHEAFFRDALKSLKLTNHPKAQVLCSMAWDDGHSSGYCEIWNCMVKFAELLQD